MAVGEQGKRWRACGRFHGPPKDGLGVNELLHDTRFEMEVYNVPLAIRIVRQQEIEHETISRWCYPRHLVLMHSLLPVDVVKKVMDYVVIGRWH